MSDHILKYEFENSPDFLVSTITSIATLTSLRLSATELITEIENTIADPIATIMDTYLNSRISYLTSVSSPAEPSDREFTVEKITSYGDNTTINGHVSAWIILSGSTSNPSKRIFLETISANTDPAVTYDGPNGGSLTTSNDTITSMTSPALTYTLSDLLLSSNYYDFAINWLNTKPDNPNSYGSNHTKGLRYLIDGYNRGVNIATENFNFAVWKVSLSSRFS